MKTKVTIIRKGNDIIVKNDKGREWKFSFINDFPTAAAIAEISSAMLTATITSQLLHGKAETLNYTLELIPGKEVSHEV